MTNIFGIVIRNRISLPTQGAFLVIVPTLGFMLWMYYENFLHLNGYLFDLHGDGLANYFSFAWHITYDQMFGHFGGMHYPYGEHLPFVDCHPALASLLRYVHKSGIPVGSYAVGILNMLMLLSPVFCAWCLYCILIKYRVEIVFAALGGTGIALLSSQVLLMQYGHYALSYSVFFPIGWYLLLKFNEHPQKTRWTVAIIFNLLFWAYTHNYLGLMLLAFYAIVHCVLLIEKRGMGISRKELFMRISHIAVPVAVIYSVAFLADPHTGRIEMPFDPAHTASAYSVFFPNYAFTRPLYEVFCELEPQLQQPWARVGNYIGLSSLLMVAVLLVLLPVHLLRRVHTSLMRVLRELYPYLTAGVVLLLFSMGWHFRLTGTVLPDAIPLLKQFVGLGRFAWVFYYVICVTTLVVLSLIQRRALRYTLLIISSFLYVAEGYNYHHILAGHIAHIPNYLDIRIPENAGLRTLVEDISIEDYQAVIPLPFYHKYVTPGTFSESAEAIQYSMRFAFLTGLPLMSAVLSRPSVEESRKIIQFFNPNAYDKPIRQDFPDQRPFLVLYTGEALEALEVPVLQLSDTLATWENLVLLELPFESCFEYDHAKAIKEFLAESDALDAHRSGWKMRDTTTYFFFEGFDHLTSVHVYRGAGSWQGMINADHVLFESAPLEQAMEYELSFWYYNHLYDQLYNHMWIEERDHLDSLVVRTYHSPTASPLSDGDWVWNAIPVRVAQDGHKIVLRSRGEARYAPVFYLDELKFRPSGLDVLRMTTTQNEDVYLKNNQTIARQPRQ